MVQKRRRRVSSSGPDALFRVLEALVEDYKEHGHAGMKDKDAALARALARTALSPQETGAAAREYRRIRPALKDGLRRMDRAERAQRRGREEERQELRCS